jgi:hypothetical protein
VKAYNRIAVSNRTHRVAVVADDHKWRQILIDHSRPFFPQHIDGFGSARKTSPLPSHVRHPPPPHHLPVGLVPIHRDLHTPATGCNPRIEAVAGNLEQDLFKPLQVEVVGNRNDIATIGQWVDPDFRHTLCSETPNERLKVVNVAVDIAVGKQPYEVERATVGLDILYQELPRLTIKYGAARDCLTDQLGALLENPPSGDSVVAHFRITHVAVAGQTYGLTVSFQLEKDRRSSKYAVEIWGGGEVKGVAFIAIGSSPIESDAIENHEQQLAWYAGELLVFFEIEFGHSMLLRRCQLGAITWHSAVLS